MTKKLENPTNRIREHRMAQGLTLANLGALTGLHTGYLSKMELGERPTTLNHLRNIANQLGLSVGDLLIDSENPNGLSVEEIKIIEAIRNDVYFAHTVKHLLLARSEFVELK